MNEPPFLDDAELLASLNELMSIPEPWEKFEGIEQLLERTPTPLSANSLRRVLSVVEAIKEPDWHAAALAVLAQHAPKKDQDELFLRALLTFREVEDPDARDAALHYVIPRMPDHILKRIWSAIRSEDSSS